MGNRVRALINSFTAGILSPRFDGRIDLDVYRKGAKTLTNWIPWPLGAVQNRSGSKYIARTKDDGQARLMPFILGQDEEYNIEIGNEYMRFYENGAQVTDNLDFVAVGIYILTSLDGITWKQISGPKLFGSNSTVYDKSIFVTVGAADGTDAYMLTSTDGVTWTERSNPKNVTLWSVVYGNSLFVAVGNKDGTDAYIVTSSDGITWAEQAPTVSKNIDLNEVVYGNSLFVAVGDKDGTDAYILTSTDAITWTEQAPTVSKNLDLVGLTYGNSLFVAVGQSDGVDAYILTSPDGITWTERAPTVAKNVALASVVYGNSLFVAVGGPDGVDSYILTSPDGITWTEQAPTVSKNIQLNSVTWSSDNSLFVAVGNADGSDAYMITSPDGITWTERSNDMGSNNLSGVYSRGQSAPSELSSPYLTAELFDVASEQKENILYTVHENHAPRQLTRIDSAVADWSISIGGKMSLDTFIMFQEPLADFSVEPAATITVTSPDTGINNIAKITADATVFKSGDIGKKIKAGSGVATILYLIGDGSATGTNVLVDIESTFDALTYASGSWELVGGGTFTLNPSAVGTPKGYIDLVNDTAVDTARNLIEVTTDRWTVSGSGTNEYYLTLAASTLPASEPGVSDVLEKGVEMYKNSAGIGSLAKGEWGWGDNDALGASTVYVRLTDEADPDSYQEAGSLLDRRHWLVYKNSPAVTPVVTAAGDSTLASEVGGFIQIASGLVEIVANVGTRTYRGRVVKELSSADATTLWTLRGKAFSATNGYPGAIAIHEDRLLFAGTDKYPLTVWGSKVGEFDNFTPGTAADDSYSFTLNAKEASKIVWLVSRDVLIAGTEGGEWQIGLRGELTTPSNVYARRHTPHGSEIRYPILAQSNILFAERGNRKLRELTFAFENNSYRAPDRILHAEHLSVNLIKQLAYQPRNNSIVWAMLEDGEVIGMAYEPNFEVYAWFKLNTGMTLAGAFDGSDDIESISVISDSSGVKELWAVVERIVNGGTIRTVEVFKNLFDSDTASEARMLDSYIVDTDLSTTVDGLGHLEGDVVTYIIDGDSTKIGTATVSSGAITVSSTPTVNVVAGIPYTSTLQTMRLEAGGERGSAQSMLKRIPKIIMRLYRAMGGKVGTTSTVANLSSIKNVATLTSADRVTNIQQGYDTDGIITVVQNQPLPITLSAMFAEVQEHEI